MHPTSIQICRSLAEDQWRCFVEEHPAGSVFHTPEMFQTFSRSKGHRPELWAAVEQDQVLALWLPVQITLRDGLLRYFTTRSVVYGGVLCAPGTRGQEALALLLRAYTREVDRPPLFTEVRNMADVSALQPILQECRFVHEDHLNYLIDLKRPPSDVFQSIGPRTRKNIRHGINRGEVNIEEVTRRDELIVVFELLSKTYQLARVPLADASLFEAAFDVLYPRGMIRFTLARVHQVAAAASVELLYKDVVYGWYGGTDRDYGAYVPNELLQWRILEWGAQNGFALYDFGGAGKPQEEYGVRTFKAKFGGQLVNFGRNRFVHAPLRARLCESVYEMSRGMLFSEREGRQPWIRLRQS